MRLLIIADDLTGAADCGITCLAAGLETVVVLEDSEPIPGVDVVSVDAATRRLSASQATEQTARLTRRYLSPQTQIVFKKLDSTLRGHVAQEIAAVLSASRALHGVQTIAVVAPSFPAMGRTMVGGRLFVRGVPVETTEIWHREALNASAYLPGRLGEHGLRTLHIDLQTVHSEKRLFDTLAGAKVQHDAVVCDAETDEDLRAIVRAGMALQTSIVWAGSAGLAAQLPHAMGVDRDRPVDGAPLSTKGPVLFVVGSPSQVSRDQVARLIAEREMESLTVSPSSLAEQTRRLGQAFATGRDVVISLESSAHLAALVSPYAPRCGGLVLTGGETARSVLNELGVATLRLIGEVEPGIPLSVATVAGSLRLPVVTKAGAFGSPRSLLNCHDALRTLRTLT